MWEASLTVNMNSITILALFLTVICNCFVQGKYLRVVTVATSITDGFERFNRSVQLNGLRLDVLGLSEQWTGGDIVRQPGGGQKVRLLRRFLKHLDDKQNAIVLFTDSYDVIINGDENEILSRFAQFDSNVVFSSEKFCWPDKSLASKYPKSDGKRYLNSGMFIGYADSLLELVSHEDIHDSDDDQLYYTKYYIDAELRQKTGIKLDLTSLLMQNLNGVVPDVEIRFSQGEHMVASKARVMLFNTKTNTEPLIIHGNGASKIQLNSIGNYLPKAWHPVAGCMACDENVIQLEELSNDQYPTVLVAINIIRPTPFLQEFLEDVVRMDYPHHRIHLLIQSLTEYHRKELEIFVENFEQYYRSLVLLHHQSDKDWTLRNRYLDECVRLQADYLFVWDSEARLDNKNTLKSLIEQNKPVIAPLLTRPGEMWSNFWGAITSTGYYSRSHDYIPIVKNERRGVWNVPYIGQAYLINASVFRAEDKVYNFKRLSYRDEVSVDANEIATQYEHQNEIDSDMFFCARLRDNGVFMFLTNLDNFGHLIQMDFYDTEHGFPEFYRIAINEIEWHRRYIHENYTKALEDNSFIEQPCPDVYWFPVVSARFCSDLIGIMERYGQWSPGKDHNKDLRLDGGYENVPTVDIHMKQVGLESQWLYFLRKYIRPMQERIFTGYFHDPPKAIMNFVVRYHPQEQAFLRPHHDASTYTINIALNRPGIDFKGGGCRFNRYNCSVTATRLGWSLIHPGRLTHLHEGLPVTGGVRYIMVSFVDP